MDTTALLQELFESMVGRTITWRRLVADSLLLYLECEPGELRHGYILWLEPTWHVSCPDGVIVGSDQAQVDSKEELCRVGRPLDQLIGQTVDAAEIDDRSNDLCLKTLGGYFAKTFVSDPTHEEIWSIADNARSVRLCASPSGLEVHAMDT